jgi:hypothetical protein
MRRLVTMSVLVCALAAGALAPTAQATATGASQAVADCNANGRLTHSYTPAELRTALSTMPADVKEYTDCYDVIQRTLLAELGTNKGAAGTVGGTGSGGSFLPTPLLVVVAVLVAGAGGFAALALRRRR